MEFRVSQKSGWSTRFWNNPVLKSGWGGPSQIGPVLKGGLGKEVFCVVEGVSEAVRSVNRYVYVFVRSLGMTSRVKQAFPTGPARSDPGPSRSEASPPCPTPTSIFALGAAHPDDDSPDFRTWCSSPGPREAPCRATNLVRQQRSANASETHNVASHAVCEAGAGNGTHRWRSKRRSLGTTQ